MTTLHSGPILFWDRCRLVPRVPWGSGGGGCGEGSFGNCEIAMNMLARRVSLPPRIHRGAIRRDDFFVVEKVEDRAF